MHYGKKIALGTLLLGAAAAGYKNPVPITTGWGQVSIQDMNAKVQIAEGIKRELVSYGRDGVWQPYEALGAVAITNPRVFTEHRVKEAKFLGINAFDNPVPKAVLEDILYKDYNDFFADGTKRVPSGPLMSYHAARREILQELYKRFVNRDRVSFEGFLRGEGFEYPILEGNPKYFNKHFIGPVDLKQTLIDQRLLTELENIAKVFSSKERQDPVAKEADDAGNLNNKVYNALLFLFAGGLASLMAEPLRNKEKRRKILGDIYDGIAFLPNAYINAIGSILERK